MVSPSGYYSQHITMSHAFSATQIAQIPLLSPSTIFRRTNSLPNTVTAFAKPLTRAANKVSSSRVAKKPAGAISRSRRDAVLAEIQQSFDLESALASSGRELKVADLNIVLRNFGKSSRWKDLIELFGWMLKHGKINAASYSSYIKFMAESRNTSKALNAYKSISDETMRNNVSICNSILSCLVKNDSFDGAIDLFERMKQSGLQPDVVTYSTLLAGCMKVKHGYTKALELVEELEDYGISMDNVIYGTLIAVCASNCQCKEAEMYYTRMKAEGHSPNMYHYSALLNAFSVEGNHQKADELIQDMKSAGLIPNKVVLTTLLKVYVKAGLFEKSRVLLSDLQVLGHATVEMPYCILMDGLSKSGKIDEAKAVFEEMNKRQVRSDGYSHSIIISALSSSGRLEEAKKWAADYEAMYNKYDVVILNAMLCAYCRAGDMESVMQTMRKMDKLAINPDQKTFHVLMTYFCKEKLYLLAYRTLEDMSSKGHPLEEEMLSSLILGLGKAGAPSEAFSAYSILKSGGVISKTLHEKILVILIAGKRLKDAYVVAKDNANLISPQGAKKFLVAYMKSGDINLINDALRVIHTSGYKIDQNVFHLAVSRYITQPEKKELLLQLLQWMPSHGYVVNSSTRNLILRNSYLFGQQVLAEILSRQHAMARPC